MAFLIDRDFVEEHLRSSLYGALRKPHEEDKRPWSGQAPVVDKPLLRLWDESSRNKPDKDNCLVSSRPQGYLHSYKARQKALVNLITASDSIYGSYTDGTPFIAFQANDSEVSITARSRRRGRCEDDLYLTVINPNIRAANGLPTLNLLEEMKYYRASRKSWDGPPDPSISYGGHFICPWQVTAAEVIGTWMWDNLCQDENWYKNIVNPAFLEHDRAAREGRERESVRPCMRNLETALPIEVDCQNLPSRTNLEPLSRADGLGRGCLA